MKQEFLIRRTDAREGDWFSLKHSQLPEVLRPISVEAETIAGPGDHRLRAAGVEVAFYEEGPGIQVVFIGDIDSDLALALTEEVLTRIREATGESGKVIAV